MFMHTPGICEAATYVHDHLLFWQRQMIFSADWLRRFFLREVIFSSWRACGRKNIELGHQLLCLSLIQTPEMKLTFVCFVV